ncbi:YlbF family regulator [Alkalicella caledoniensis]|uniref:YlbF family regulator n=1 Tax=Alkalicella caledoniensis TaxID=2731377 RepID=A0A7G9W521_ALKCA|nr:YlbF family regulator [Alkalicella caledoniensis]QNO13783.1 YlbF family regulator [Alkalicella caledoniensis]
MIKEKALELANLIKDSEEFKAVKSAEARLKLDPNAQDLINEFQGIQQRVMEKQYQGQQPEAEDIQQLQGLQGQLQLNLTVKALVEAQETFEKMMTEVNETIGQELSK